MYLLGYDVWISMTGATDILVGKNKGFADMHLSMVVTGMILLDLHMIIANDNADFAGRTLIQRSRSRYQTTRTVCGHADMKARYEV